VGHVRRRRSYPALNQIVAGQSLRGTAVRIPAEFRLATDLVQITRSPNGDLTAICRHYAVQAPTPIGGNDLWIACHALPLVDWAASA